MSEQELFYWEKIRRGVNRENNCNDLYLIELKFEKLFYEFEKKILSPRYMSGYYLSRWVRILEQNVIEFIKQEFDQ